METTQVAVDLAKSVFEIAVSHDVAQVAEHRRLNRSGFRRFLKSLGPSEILMEACGTSHYWGRQCSAMGHRVRLLPAGDVRPYRDGNRTDRTDTRALLEASRNRAIDAVPVKTEAARATDPSHARGSEPHEGLSLTSRVYAAHPSWPTHSASRKATQVIGQRMPRPRPEP